MDELLAKILKTVGETHASVSDQARHLQDQDKKLDTLSANVNLVRQAQVMQGSSIGLMQAECARRGKKCSDRFAKLGIRADNTERYVLQTSTGHATLKKAALAVSALLATVATTLGIAAHLWR